MKPEHFSVLLDESVNALLAGDRGDGRVIGGTYIDGTFGRGGHTRKILASLPHNSKLLVFDKDPEAIEVAGQMASADGRLIVHRGSFAQMDEVIGSLELGGVDGILLDLGVSSPQLDNAERGFSFLRDGPLDMRMDPDRGESAADWINRESEQGIAQVIWEYGEERYSRRIARAIVTEREGEPINRTARLADIVKRAHPRWEKDRHPATKTFQGIRIHINRELEDLERALEVAVKILRPGGRLVVISFHSLEDRIVKQFFRRAQKGPTLPKEVAITNDMWEPSLKSIGKAVRAGTSELDQNVRSRSATMRVAEKPLPVSSV